MKKTKFNSWKINDIAKGCKLCVQGRKTVLFITGICSKHCFYCPISEQKYQKDVIYANEWKITKFNQLIEEIKLCSSQGVGITGGDPLTKITRTVNFIRQLKKTFGKKFHIHLYTPLELVTKTNLTKLHDAGLDEIRFNPDLDKPSLWKKIDLATRYKWDVGIEIPVIPGYMTKTKNLVKYIETKVKFLNLNELEISDTNSNELLKKGFRPKNSLSYAVKKSQEMAFQLLKHLKDTRLKVHYCTATLKDKVQLRKRIQLRAKNHATKYDKITADGTLKRTILYLDELKPGFRYKEKIKKANKKKLLEKLNDINKKINGMIDKDSYRIIINKTMITKAKQIPNTSVAIIEEYPTKDAMLIDVEFL